jgi:hypothetical protein
MYIRETEEIPWRGEEFSKGSFDSHHLGLESKNSFMILTITCLTATELVIESIWNSMGFHLMSTLIPIGYPVISVDFSK